MSLSSPLKRKRPAAFMPRLAAAYAQGAAQWRLFSARERRLMAAAALCLSAASAWLLLVNPALGLIAHWRQEIPKLQSQASALEDVLGEAAMQAPVAPAGDAAAQLARLRLSLDAAGLQGRYEVSSLAGGQGAAPDAPRADVIRVEIKGAPIDQLMPWLTVWPDRLGHEVVAVALERSGPAVSAESGVAGHLDLGIAHISKDGS
ncbi:type II secretion system protein GspM [Pollutimonas bauzanensis]|uniref:Type II secretion system (T2SS), protein M n=1 Tax=Pollutimonas bauzanensis TaxID=658167 RepID=A0A1M6BDQ8_9BURK|nr:type II secretion system protein GspM [Pollutimonas bauzanensis]SHI46849.1 Type II secretion system (T2SS), protein M [Pollutimonas bauzanensis]